MTDQARHAGSLSSRIAILLDELELAIKWDRPCIAFAVYRSEFVREQVQSRLRKSPALQGHNLREYEIDRDHFDVALELRDRPDRHRTVYLVSGLQWGGGRGRTHAYHALNMHREYLVEEKIRSVFWMTMKEARLLPRHAPDFWAFRSNVVEFFDLPGGLHHRSSDGKNGEPGQAIAALLAGLEKKPADTRLRIKLAGLYREVGFLEDAIAAYRQVLRVAPRDANIRLEIAEIYLEWKRPDTAARIIRKVAGEGGGEARRLGRLQQLARTIRAGKQARSGISE